MLGFPKSLRNSILNQCGLDLFNLPIASKPRLDFDVFEKEYLTNKQYAILKDIEHNDYRKIIFNGAIGSGKTFLACYFMIKNLIQNRHLYKSNTNNCVFGTSIDTLHTITLKEFGRVCDLLGISFIDKKTNNSHCFIDGLRLKLYGGIDVGRFSKFRGSNTALVYVNEATLMNKETLIEIMKRLRSGQQTIIFDTNPDHPMHYFKTDYVDNTTIYKTYNFTMYDNPHLPKEYISMHEIIGEQSPVHRERNILGKWVASESTIFRNINVISSTNFRFVSPIMYIDPAFSAGGDNTAVCVMEKRNDKFYALVFQAQLPIIDMAVLTTIAKMIQELNVYTVYVEDRDSVNTRSSIVRSLENLRYNLSVNFIIQAIKPKTSKYDRILNLIVPFATSRLSLFEECTPSVFSDIYSYKGLSSDKVKDDALDAISGAYLFLTLTGNLIRKYYSISKYFNI